MSKTYAKKSVEDKRKEVEELTNGMEKKIEQHFHSAEELKDYLSFMGKFYQYSMSNTVLIQKQFRGAQAVGSFKFWKDKGFSVNKGEKGIKILVPNKTVPKFKDEKGKWKSVNKATPQEKQLIKEGKKEVTQGRLYFLVGHVFDIHQTNATANDLPKIFPNRWLEGNVEDYKTLYKGMEAIAEKNGISIIAPKEELGSAKGACYPLTKKVALNPRNSERQNVKTLLHEITHAKLHTEESRANYTDAEREFQAEMTAYTVSSYFGVDTSEYSLGYLSHWTKGKSFEDKTKILKEVHETSVGFIETIEEKLVKEREKKDEKQQQADPLSPQNVQEKMKEGYEDYKQKQQQESAQNVDSILDRVTAEEKYYSTKTQAIKNGWMTKEEVVKLEHQIDSTMTKNEKGVMNGQVQEQSFTFQERVEVGNHMQFQKRTGTVKKKKEEQELER
ncbi:ArdC-like ssDNA-binding domain-containing protein [Priestia megaterium]|nr:ArdC-like ssDNA-binding domain-containing protein [Priestia megaterium]